MKRKSETIIPNGSIVRHKDEYMDNIWGELEVIGNEMSEGRKPHLVYELRQTNPDPIDEEEAEQDRLDEKEFGVEYGPFEAYHYRDINHASADQLVIVRVSDHKE